MVFCISNSSSRSHFSTCPRAFAVTTVLHNSITSICKQSEGENIYFHSQLKGKNNTHLLGLNGLDRKVLGKVQLCDSRKTLFQIDLNLEWIFGLGKYLQQLVVGDEEESGKVKALLVQVLKAK